VSNPQPPTDLPGWVIGVAFTAVSAMAGIIGKMFYMMRGDTADHIATLQQTVDKLEAEAKECREDRDQIWRELSKMGCDRGKGT
jgi:hypothetical protein